MAAFGSGCVCMPSYVCPCMNVQCMCPCILYSVFSILCSVFRVWMLCSFAWVAGADDLCGDCAFCVEGGSGLRAACARARRSAQVRRAQTASTSTATAVPSTSVASSFQLVERSVRVCGFVHDRNGGARRPKKNQKQVRNKVTSVVHQTLFVLLIHIHVHIIRRRHATTPVSCHRTLLRSIALHRLH